mmetsp:Transcript_54817/g.90934  ORF Transcript_54817/g.90934 Transcript_54817/m.90934 type:complete len:96 (-) Transcript_54817:22-309(-)
MRDKHDENVQHKENHSFLNIMSKLSHSVQIDGDTKKTPLPFVSTNMKSNDQESKIFQVLTKLKDSKQCDDDDDGGDDYGDQNDTDTWCFQKNRKE